MLPTREYDWPLIFSFSFLFFLFFQRAIITPNGREFDRLFQAFQPTLEGVDTFKLSSRGEWSESEEGEMVEQGRTESTRQVVALAKFFDGVTILKKGGIDVISDGTAVLLNSVSF